MPKIGHVPVILAAVIGLCTIGLAASRQAPEPAGRAAFETRCASCHGADGRGNGAIAGIAGIATMRATAPAELRELFRTGIPGTGMPAFALPDAELDALAAYVT